MNFDKTTTTPVLVIGGAAILLVASLLGPAWIFVPADPTTGAPALNLSFSDLDTLMSQVPSTGWQRAYFGWLGWFTVVVTLGIAVAAWLRPSRIGWLGLVAACLFGLVGSVFALKGLMTWTQFADSAENLRAGGHASNLGFSVLLILGVVSLVRSRTSARSDLTR